MKNLLPVLIIIAMAFVSCAKQTAEPIQFDIPQSLVGDAPLNEFLEEYAQVGGNIIACSQKLRSGANMAQMAKTTAVMAKAAERLKELKAICPEIEESISDRQKKDFQKVIYQLDASIGQMNTDLDAIDESEMAAVQANKNKQQSELDSITALRNEAVAQQKAAGTYIEPGTESDAIEMPRYMTFVFPALGIAAFIFFALFGLRRMVRNKISEVGYAFGDAKNAVNDLKQKVAEGEAEGKTLTDEEKKGIEFLDNYLNKK